jgi:hypothetical protein
MLAVFRNGHTLPGQGLSNKRRWPHCHLPDAIYDLGQQKPRRSIVLAYQKLCCPMSSRQIDSCITSKPPLVICCDTEIAVGKIGILVGASDVGIESTNANLGHFLESYHPLACIEFFSILNCVCAHRAYDSSDDRELVAKLLPHFETRILDQLANNHRDFVFHRTSLLWLIKNCTRFCSLSGKKQLHPVDFARLSSSVRIANDLRTTGQTIGGNTIDRISALLPFSRTSVRIPVQTN